MGSGSNMKSLNSLEGESSNSLSDVSEILDNFSDSVDASSEGLDGVKVTAGRVLLCLGDLVVSFVCLEEGESSSGTLSFLGLNLDGLKIERVAVAETGLSGVVEVSKTQGIAGECLTVELNQESVVLLCQLPQYTVGKLHHLPTKCAINISIFISQGTLPYVINN